VVSHTLLFSVADEPVGTSLPRSDGSAHAAQSGMRLRDIIAKLRHDGCGGRAGRVELLTGIEGASSRPVRKIVVLDG
jgi:hypothetical protein